MRYLLISACIFLPLYTCYAQGDSLVRSIINHAQEVEEQGNFDYAVDLLSSNVKKYKTSKPLRNELANIYYRQDLFKKSLKQCKVYERKFGSTPAIIQLKAHNFINLGKLDKTKRMLKDGLEQFIDEGLLYVELGRLAMHRERYEEAIDWFEEGVKEAPNYSGNYYWASKIYLQSTEELWGLFYGELFMNLDPLSQRASEISSLLFETLNREIVFYNDTSISVNICKDANFSIPYEDTADYISYGQDIIEPLFKSSLTGFNHLSLRNIDYFRKRVLSNYEKLDSTGYPDHFLFNFYEELNRQGHFEAYNYWLFMMGNPQEFEAWERDNSSQWKLFINWYEKYQFQIDKGDYYYAKQFR